MFDWIGYAETHGVLSTIVVTVIFSISIALGMFTRRVWREHTEAGMRIQELVALCVQIQTSVTDKDKAIEAALSTAADIAQKVSTKFWRECREMRCPKIDTLTAKFDAQNQCLHRFVDDAKISREITQDAVRRIEHAVNLFVNEMGREMLRSIKNNRENGK